MNERIRELWSQAGGHYDRGNQHTWPQYTIDDPAKFAEMIVRECMDICKAHPSRILSNNWYADAVAPDIVNRFEEHFGVKE